MRFWGFGVGCRLEAFGVQGLGCGEAAENSYG